jgi:uncharacterized membrane protein
MPPLSAAAPRQRLPSIDLLRGGVMLLMLLDHVRETFYLQHQVSDPMDVTQVSPALYACRMLAHLCAPVFVGLTGLSAWLYGQNRDDPRRAASAFLFKRGLFLVALELTLVNFAWTFQFPPSVVYLQVIWAIGLSMIALAGLLWLPRAALVAVGLLLVAGHNLLDPLQASGTGPLAVLWKVLHQRDWIVLGDELRLRTSYPLLPWIGVIALGYAAGPWYGRATDAAARRRRLLGTGLALLAGFLALRLWNGYGDTPWQSFGDPRLALMSFFNVTKYPPSLCFLLLTLGIGLLLLRLFEWPALSARLGWMATFGAAPMFFYLLHLYVLKALYLVALAWQGANQGQVFGFDHVASLWAVAALLALALYWPVRAFARFKARRRDLAWLRYL